MASTSLVPEHLATFDAFIYSRLRRGNAVDPVLQIERRHRADLHAVPREARGCPQLLPQAQAILVLRLM